MQGGGWLAELGFHDFAVPAVHSVGGWLALVSAATVGPRIGKYKCGGTLNDHHNIALGALGVFILWFCWFGFNCGSRLHHRYSRFHRHDHEPGRRQKPLVALVITWVRYGKPMFSMTLNGSAGLVGITADVMSYPAAQSRGAICGVVVVAVIELLDKKIKVMTWSEPAVCIWPAA